ncbi:uncharacterized protein LOC123195789 [Mangifera indica]|uniref:uncharacterized protein LOC123195789 n=1 Tax=Mangifera indica TaxID=29780 RepID=UPI001CFB7F2D|nr:uncharacterized protein LOC123195789 [Mangifera indica]
MQRLCNRFRSLTLQTLSSSSRRLLHSSSPIRCPVSFPSSAKRSINYSPSVSALSTPLRPLYFSQLPLSLVQVRHVSSRERKKRRKPMTPATSKVKKVKMKFYSSYKLRFRPLKDGTIRRWHEGKNHNAHQKSKKSKRRLRQPALVPPAFAKVMKKLNFLA